MIGDYLVYIYLPDFDEYFFSYAINMQLYKSPKLEKILFDTMLNYQDHWLPRYWIVHHMQLATYRNISWSYQKKYPTDGRFVKRISDLWQHISNDHD